MNRKNISIIRNQSFVHAVFFIFVTVAALCLSGCSKEDEPFMDSDAPTPQVIFLFSPGGLGDMSYNDCILSGIQRFKRENPEVDVFLYSPPSMEVAERIFSDWMKRPGSNIPVVFALASSDFESMVDNYIDDYPLSDNKRILLFESLKDYGNDHIHTFHISMYGASYLAGLSAAEMSEGGRSLVLLGSSTDVPVESARDGFIAGLNCDNYDIEYLADDWTGYVMANYTYQKMSDWSSRYSFIFPVAGGSNTGLYRYTREFADAPFLAGMDIDQSDLSKKITGSVVKRFDILINEYFTWWLNDGNMPAWQIYTLQSGYVDWQLSPLYSGKLNEIVEKGREKAIKEEEKYYEAIY